MLQATKYTYTPGAYEFQIQTNLDFKHYIMDDIVMMGTTTVAADVIDKVFGVRKEHMTVSDMDFTQRRFRRWCEYHGVSVNTKTDTKTGKPTSYDLSLYEQAAISA